MPKMRSHSSVLPPDKSVLALNGESESMRPRSSGIRFLQENHEQANGNLLEFRDLKNRLFKQIEIAFSSFPLGTKEYLR